MRNLRPTGNERSVQVMNKKKYSSIWRVYVSELYRLFHKRSFWLAFMVLFLYAAADYLHTASWIIRGFVKEPYAASGYFMGAYQSFNKYQPIFIKVFRFSWHFPVCQRGMRRRKEAAMQLWSCSGRARSVICLLRQWRTLQGMQLWCLCAMR